MKLIWLASSIIVKIIEMYLHSAGFDFKAT